MKNYVKEYAGHQVPEGATHYLDGNRFFYNADKVLCFDTKRPQEGWRKTIFHGIASEATPLPEAPQEWMPEVGEECEVMTDPFEWGKCTADYIGAEFIVYTANSGEGSSIKKFFRPLKTQQEKDREAFMSAARKATNCDKEDWCAIGIFKDMFHAGFTAPKEVDNDK